METNRKAIRAKLGRGLACVAAGVLLLPAAIPRKKSSGFAFGEDSAASAPQSVAGKRAPVLVELFTSEGCSSCPPADALVARLEKTQPVAGAEVVVLKEHVDYWNHLGWRDPFSAAQFSARQNDYAQAFGSAQVYTPQMIVDGGEEFVGSDASRARRAIARAAQAPKAEVHLAWQQSSAAGGSLPLAVRIAQLPAPSPGDTQEVFLAVTEDHLHSDVLRGENVGSKFDHLAVVRELRRIGKADPQAATAFEAGPVVTLSGGWKRENLRVIVFVQERNSRRVLALAAIPAVPH